MSQMKLVYGFLLFIISFGTLQAANIEDFEKSPYIKQASSLIDTIPIKERFGDFINDPSDNPFDIYPSDIKQTVDYDPDTDQYIITEMIGDEFFRAPTYLTFEEYLAWKAEQDQKNYFSKLSGISSGDRGNSGLVDPMSKINIEKKLADRLFGGNGISIKPQGNVDVKVGLDYFKTQNPALTLQQQRQFGFDFLPDIKINIDGSIGDKMNLGFNYDTQASFDFDRKINLVYDSEEFTEDDILKRVEAGNVSLPLRGSLIQGAQSLFGLKTVLQFGHLKLTGIASQQQSERKQLSIQNGASVKEFEIRPDEYDENRHFFISHYHRNAYTQALSNLPQIRNNFRVANIQVWISDDQQNYQENSTKIVAIADLGEGVDSLLDDPSANYTVNPAPSAIFVDANGNILPDNRANDLYESRLEVDELARRSEFTNTQLSSEYGMEQISGYEIYRGRLLNPNEYTFNAELGFISLNIKLQPNQVLGVAYQYYYTANCDEVYKVGEMATDALSPNTREDVEEQETESVLYVKMLKSTNQQPGSNMWDLMMKNVYPLRTSQLTKEDFVFDIFYEDDQTAKIKKFLPIDGLETTPLLNVFNLDRLNSQNDPQPDGVFDFAPGITVLPRNGTIIFPVLEPFGRDLDAAIGDKNIPKEKIDSLRYNQLYELSITNAREYLHLNKFVMLGKYKSDVSSEISLGSWNIPQGENSVIVRAGGKVLREGQDYEIDYGIGRLRILNEAYLQQGVPITVDFEDNSFFNVQQKTMLGLRADYEYSEKLSFGATYLKLKERPLTQKVNIGDDPINNRIFGFDVNYTTETPWMTKALDRLPLYSTKEPSQIQMVGEVAALVPGHSRAINLNDEKGGVVNIDDFEGAVSGLPLGTQPLRWILASVPRERDEYLAPDLESGFNRAALSWYVIDPLARQGVIETSFSRPVAPTELFNRTLLPSDFPDLRTFDMTYDPTSRGPYNFDRIDASANSAGVSVENGEIKLNEPETRWAGVMTYMNNSDFEATNYEFIDFWMLNPFMDSLNTQDGETGKLVFHLGNVSEDVLGDNIQFYENTIPVEADSEVPIRNTAFGKIPLVVPNNLNGFDIDNREQQDLGFDGLNNSGERLYFEEYVNEMIGEGAAVADDPSNDDWIYYDSPALSNETNLIERYKRFNAPEGNTPEGSLNERGNPFPEKEELNGNASLDQGEGYYKYEIVLENDDFKIDTTKTNFIRDRKSIIYTNANNESVEEIWYRFQVPIRDLETATPVGNISGFRSIQFMRMILEGFEQQKTFRMAELELVRSQWRTLLEVCDGDQQQPEFYQDIVSIQENTRKTPYPYVLPRGIKQEVLQNSFANVEQDERSVSLNFCKFTDPGCEPAIYKLTELDLRVFDKLQMFVHAEEEEIMGVDFSNDDLSLVVKIGKDFISNYYEYEIPLELTDEDIINNQVHPDTLASFIWRDVNFMDLQLSDLTDLKLARNSLGFSPTEFYEGTPSLKPNHKIGIIGNPNLGFIKGISIGLRINNEDFVATDGICGEVWVNELRAVGFEERGGVASVARVDWQLADLGNVTVSGKYNSIGWGALDQKLDERLKEEIIEYDAATNLELGKFFPNKWNVRVPFYAQYAKSISNPQFDPFDLDLTLEEKLAANPAKRDSIKNTAQDVTTIKTINLINVRKEKSRGGPKGGTTGPISLGGKNTKPGAEGAVASGGAALQNKPKPKRNYPWDISNFSASYAYTETDKRDPLLEFDNTKEYKAGIDYTYKPKSKSITPFKKMVKSDYLKFIKEFNFNPVPNSFSFTTDMNRRLKTRRFRLPVEPVFEFDERFFTWERRYNLNWNLAKSLKLKFSATNMSFIDEYRQTGIQADPVDREWINEVGDTVTDIVRENENQVTEYWQNNLRDGGRNTKYNHQAQLSYDVPLKHFPFINFISIKGQYKADYSWLSGPLIDIEPGNPELVLPGAIIQNGQNRSITADFDLNKLYKKSKYLKSLDKIEDKKSKTKEKKKKSREKDDDKADKDKEDPKNDRSKDRTKKTRVPSTFEKIVVRPLFLLRGVKFQYKEDFTTLIPGFMPSTNLLGMDRNFVAPGWDFVAGIQPDITYRDKDNWLYGAAANGWINESLALNQQIQTSRRQDMLFDVELEPWKGFDIDLTMNKKFNYRHNEEFRKKNNTGDPQEDWIQLAQIENGSFEMSYFAVNTLFGNRTDELFNTFIDNTAIVSENYQYEAGSNVPNEFDPHTQNDNNPGYTYGLGKLNNEIIIPAFIAAYTETNPLNSLQVDYVMNPRDNWKFLPRPNWQISYKNLNKLPWFKDRLKSFKIDHGYKSSLTINNYNLNPEYTIDDPYSEIREVNGNYFTRWEIPEIAISEQFSPIVGFSMKTLSDYTLDFQYKKSRNLALSTAVGELRESSSTEFVFGAGTVLEDINIGFLTGDRKGKKKKKRADDDKDKDGKDVLGALNSGNRQGRGINNNKPRTLTLNLDFSYRDTDELIHDILTENPTNESVRGSTIIILSPSAEYAITNQLSLRYYFDYSNNRPKNINTFETTSIETGFVVRFKLDY